MGIVGNLHLERAIAARHEGDYDAALAELQAALAEDPASAQAYHQLGLVYGFTAEFDESLEALQKAVELDGTDMEMRIDLAKTQAMLGYFDEARASFEEVLRQDPANAVAQAQLALFS